jgi:hypothetical protein
MARRAVFAALFLVGIVSAACSDGQAVPPLQAEGWGGAGAATAFDKNALEVALPGFTVTRETHMSEGMDFPVYSIEDEKGVPLALVMESGAAPGKIGRMVFEDPRISLEGRVSIGARYAALAAAEPGLEDCLPGVEEASGTVFCADGAAENIRLQFTGDWEGPDGVLPPPGILETWKLSTLVWLAPQR